MRRFRSAMVRVSAVRWYQRVRSGQGWMADVWCGLGQYRQARRISPMTREPCAGTAFRLG